MRTIGIGVVLALVAAVVVMAAQPVTPSTLPNAPAAQMAAQEMKTFASAADVQTLLAKAKVDRKEGQAIVSEHILSLAPYSINLEYRATAGSAAVHEKEAELIYVIDGSGTLTTGGELVGERRTNSANLVGTAIQGGSAQTIGKGDFMIVPEGTPHQVSAVNGVLILMSFHVPRPVPGAQ
jgi:mannose-6-phosphate isomerase-like protein (cupin superfamily)